MKKVPQEIDAKTCRRRNAFQALLGVSHIMMVDVIVGCPETRESRDGYHDEAIRIEQFNRLLQGSFRLW
jgi:hypothetical protein